MDRARPVRVHRQALQAPVRELLAPPRPAAPSRDMDPRCGVARDPGVRGQAPLCLHGHPVLPHQRVRAHVHHDARGVPERGVRRRSSATRMARADFRGRHRRRGPAALRGALLVLRPTPPPRHQHLASGVHLGALVGEHHEECRDLRPQPRLVGRGRRGPVRHRGIPRDGHRAARRQRRTIGGGQSPRALPAGNPSRRGDETEPRALRGRGHAEAARLVPRHRAGRAPAAAPATATS